MFAQPRNRAKFILLITVLLGGTSFPLHAEADAPTCRYEVTADTALDRVTKLIWQRNLDGTLRSQQQSGDYCSKLVLGGMSGWRLPTVKELQTIVDTSRSGPAADPAAFPGIPSPSAAHWTSTLLATDNTKAWFVQFADGSALWKEVTTGMYTRCVK